MCENSESPKGRRVWAAAWLHERNPTHNKYDIIVRRLQLTTMLWLNHENNAEVIHFK